MIIYLVSFKKNFFPNKVLRKPIIGTEKFINSVTRRDLIDYVDKTIVEKIKES